MAIIKECENCGKDFDRVKSPTRKFCTHSCYTASRIRPLAVRFWEKVDKRGPRHPILKTRCWMWTGAHMPRGYGMILRSTGDSRPSYAPRVSYELATGVEPGALWVLHRCDNPPCVRPEHLFLGTRLDNIRDMHAKGRASGGSMPGGSHPLAKLTDAQRKEIQSRPAGYGSRVALAVEFGVCTTTITRVRHSISSPLKPTIL